MHMYNYRYVQFLINKHSRMYVYIHCIHACLTTDDGFGEVEAERLDSLCIRNAASRSL